MLGPGADDVDSYEALCNFVAVVSARGGVDHFIIHARKCLLKGLSPHENRTIPPLRCALWSGGRPASTCCSYSWLAACGLWLPCMLRSASLLLISFCCTYTSR